MVKILSLTLVIITTSIYSRDRDLDIREVCRQAASGYYINLHNQIVVAQSSVKQWKSKLKAGASELKKVEIDLRELEKRASGQFRKDWEDQILGLRNKKEILRLQQQQGAQMIKKEKVILAEVQSRLEDFQRKLSGLFLVKKQTIVHSKRPGYRLVYSHVCGQYEKICPLPKAQRAQLQTLAADIPESTSCVRYAQVLPVRPR